MKILFHLSIYLSIYLSSIVYAKRIRRTTKKKKIKNRKAAGIDEIPPEVWKIRQFKDIQLLYCNAVYNQNIIDRLTKGCILLFPQKSDLGIAKNYRGITHTSIIAKIYNTQQHNGAELEIEKIPRKNQNGYWRNRSTTSQILTIRRMLEATLLFIDFSIWLHT